MGKMEDTIVGIKPLDEKAMAEARKRQDCLTKPLGSLGQLESSGITATTTSGMPRATHASHPTLHGLPNVAAVSLQNPDGSNGHFRCVAVASTKPDSLCFNTRSSSTGKPSPVRPNIPAGNIAGRFAEHRPAHRGVAYCRDADAFRRDERGDTLRRSPCRHRRAA